MTEYSSPAAAAEALSGSTPPSPYGATPAGSVTLLALGPSDNGYFQLSWKVTSPGSYDWIALYKVSAPDEPYPGGATSTWQWATKGSTSGSELTYVTNEGVREVGYQARYFTWDADAKAYRVILKTPEYRGKVCTS
jgi:hypothetical protein